MGGDAVRTAKADEFLRLAKMEDLLRQRLVHMASRMKSDAAVQTLPFRLSPEHEESLSEFQERVVRLLSSALAWETVRPAFVEAFAAADTEEELDSLTGFYGSPEGQVLVAKNPTLKAGEIVEAKIAELRPELRNLLREFLARGATDSRGDEGCREG